MPLGGHTISFLRNYLYSVCGQTNCKIGELFPLKQHVSLSFQPDPPLHLKPACFVSSRTAGSLFFLWKLCAMNFLTSRLIKVAAADQLLYISLASYYWCYLKYDFVYIYSTMAVNVMVYILFQVLHDRVNHSNDNQDYVDCIELKYMTANIKYFVFCIFIHVSIFHVSGNSPVILRDAHVVWVPFSEHLLL